MGQTDLEWDARFQDSGWGLGLSWSLKTGMYMRTWLTPGLLPPSAFSLDLTSQEQKTAAGRYLIGASLKGEH